MLEGPYILASGLPGPTSLSPAAGGRLLVATTAGAVLVEPDGERQFLGISADRVTTTPHHHVFLHRGVVSWRPDPLVARAQTGAGSVAVPSATDVLGWSEDSVLVASQNGIVQVTLSSGSVEPWSEQGGVTALALAASTGQVFALRDSELWLLGVDRGHPLGPAVPGLRQVAVDRSQRVWGVVDDTLVEVTPEGPVFVAGHLGDPRDLHAGAGAGLPPDHLYVADASGVVAFVPLPPLAPLGQGGPPLAKPGTGR